MREGVARFYELPRFVSGLHNDWPMVREKQFEVAQEDPRTGLVTTIVHDQNPIACI